MENRTGIGKDILVSTCVRVDGDEGRGPNAGVDGVGQSSMQESHDPIRSIDIPYMISPLSLIQGDHTSLHPNATLLQCFSVFVLMM